MDEISDAVPGTHKLGAADGGSFNPTLAGGIRQFEEAVEELEVLARSIKAVRRRAAFKIVRVDEG